jgi:alkyldihydroxyacetonephosphate synthase
MTLALDEKSLLARVDGGATLAEIESALATSGMTLDVEGATDSRETIAAWLASGAHGARDAWLDPADHLVAGLEVKLHDGRSLVVRPAPRRAVGPDLIALIVGMGERYGKVASAWLRVHPKGAKRPDVGRLLVDLDPPLSPEEAGLLATIASELELRKPKTV